MQASPLPEEVCSTQSGSPESFVVLLRAARHTILRPLAGAALVRGGRDVAAEMESLDVREHVVLEASGGITFEGLSDWKESGMDVISTSAVNRGVAPLDLTMLMDGV